jgi:trk system potassium uptake protein TrkA
LLIEEATGSGGHGLAVAVGPHRVNLVETVIGTASAAAGRALGDLILPGGCLVATVIRAGRPTVPAPGFVLQPGDELLMVAARHLPGDAVHGLGLIGALV